MLGLVGPVSVYCDWVRWKVWSATSVSVWQHVKLSEQICPWDTLACCWDIKQPANKQTPLYQLIGVCWWVLHVSASQSVFGAAVCVTVDIAYSCWGCRVGGRGGNSCQIILYGCCVHELFRVWMSVSMSVCTMIVFVSWINMNGVSFTSADESQHLLLYSGPPFDFERDSSEFYEMPLEPGAIVGIVIAGVVLIVVVAGIAIYCCLKQRQANKLRRRRDEASEAKPAPSVSISGQTVPRRLCTFHFVFTCPLDSPFIWPSYNKLHPTGISTTLFLSPFWFGVVYFSSWMW